jgi:hypothetical protein
LGENAMAVAIRVKRVTIWKLFMVLMDVRLPVLVMIGQMLMANVCLAKASAAAATWYKLYGCT